VADARASRYGDLHTAPGHLRKLDPATIPRIGPLRTTTSRPTQAQRICTGLIHIMKRTPPSSTISTAPRGSAEQHPFEKLSPAAPRSIS